MSSIEVKKIKQRVVNSVVQPLYIGGTADDGSDAKIIVETDGKVSIPQNFENISISGTATVPTVSTDDNSTNAASTAFVKNAINLVSTSGGGSDVYGLIYNYTDDTYKRFGTGTSEDNIWLSTTAKRLNDESNTDAVSTFFNNAKTVQGNMKRVVLDNTGTYIKDYSATSYSHTDQTGLTATQAVMVPIKKFYYVQVDFTWNSKSYKIFAQSLTSFSLDLASLGFSGATGITGQNVTGYASYGSIVGTTVTSILHPAYNHQDGSIKDNLYFGAFKSYNIGSGYKSTCTTTGTSTPVKATGNQTIATYRTQHQTFGSNYRTQNWLQREAMILTALIERGTFLTEINGTSQGNKWEGYSWNTIASADDQNLGLTLVLGNSTGVIKDSSNRTIANTYRGIEGYHSHLWEFVDGINIIEGRCWVAKSGATYVSDTTASPYFDSGRTTLTSGSAIYTSNIHQGTFIPSAATSGSNLVKMTDAGWYATGNRVLIVGGALNNPGVSGVTCWSSAVASSHYAWNFVARSVILA